MDQQSSNNVDGTKPEALQGSPQGPNKTAGARARPGKSAYIAAVLFILIIILDIYLRLGMFKFAGFFEPDGFYHFAVIRAAVLHGFAIPKALGLSGFPAHFAITEPLGLYFVTLVPYAVVQYFGISYYTVERLVPVLFGVFDAIGAFFIVKYFAKSRALSFIAMFLVAVSSGDIARTAALVYRGDGFITIFVLLSLIAFLSVFKQKALSKRVGFAILSAFILGVGTAVWNGAPFAVIVYMLALIFIIAFGYIIANKRYIEDSIILALALLVEYGMQHLWMALTIIRGTQALSTLHFFIFYAPVLLGALVTYFLLANRDRFAAITSTTVKRSEFLGAVLIIALIVIAGVFGRFLGSVASGDGLVIASSHLTETIQELQPPTAAFIWASFAFQIILAPIGIAMYLLFSRRVYMSADMTTVKQLNFSPIFMAMLAYFIATLYLQLNAVRFNSIVAVPIAVFAAYAIYSIGKLLGVNQYIIQDIRKKHITVFKIAFIVVVGFILIYSVYYTQRESYTSVQADGINANFLAALSWAKNNTPSNATFLAVWPDGSVIEGWANRTSAMDSVGGQNGPLIAGFSRFILNTTPDTNYLVSKVHRPEYLLARYYWLDELGGISVEGGLSNAIAASYGYDTFDGISISKNNTSELLYFQMPQAPYLKSLMVINDTNSSDIKVGIANATSDRYALVKHILLYNMDTGNYTYINSTLAYVNYTYMVTYAGNQIESTALLGPNFTKSNAFDFLFGCSYDNCSYGVGTGVSMKLVYQNSDSRIFKISYANSSS